MTIRWTRPPVCGSALAGATDTALPAGVATNACPTNPIYFDTFGMRWKAGARVRF